MKSFLWIEMPPVIMTDERITHAIACEECGGTWLTSLDVISSCGRGYQVACRCGRAMGPESETYEGAIAAWNHVMLFLRRCNMEDQLWAAGGRLDRNPEDHVTRKEYHQQLLEGAMS